MMNANTVNYPMASNILRLQNYLLPPDEAVFLDWLLVKYVSFKFDPFYYSYRRITEELRIKRTRLDAIMRKFREMGILLVEAKGSSEIKTKVSYFTVMPQKIEQHLPKIISMSNADYFKEWEAFVSSLKEGIKVEKTSKAEKKTGEAMHKRLVGTYNDRIRMYNDGDLTGSTKPKRKKSETSLPISASKIKKLASLANIHGEEAVNNAFIAIADEYLKGKLKCCHRLLDYFLSFQEGSFPVFNRYLDCFNEKYSHQ